MSSGIFSIDRVLYSLRLMLTSVSADVDLGLDVRPAERRVVLSARAIPPPKKKREVTTRDYQRMDALHSTIQDFLEFNFPRTHATSLDFVLIYARLIRKCEICESVKHISILVC